MRALELSSYARMRGAVRAAEQRGRELLGEMADRLDDETAAARQTLRGMGGLIWGPAEVSDI
jgi:hypothetical protein